MPIRSITQELIGLIGSPFANEELSGFPSDRLLLQIYEKAFCDRVAPLYLHKFRHKDWSAELEEHFQAVKNREGVTLKVLADLAYNLNEWDKNGYVIFKSIKPYPAIPNDTDLLIFGGKKEFNSTLEHLYKLGYVFHEWAPMQTTLYDPRGKGKIGAGKKGGTYYIDVYQEISTDYVCYLSEKAIKPLVEVREINSVPVKILRPEPELAVILFHNVFPERTFQLEHFYMPLYYLSDPKFDIDLFARFTERNRMTYAVKTNLSFVEQLHQSFFGFVPEVLEILLDGWGRNYREVKRFKDAGLETPYLFSPKTFWNCAFMKLGDATFIKSLFTQALHMLNPIFFWDVMVTLKRRFSESGVYHME
jgi:hypothetical protein